MSQHVTYFKYDKGGRLTEKWAEHVAGGAWGHKVYQTYYNTGKLAEIYQLTDDQQIFTRVGVPGGPASEWVTISYRGSAFGYDAAGNVVSQDLRESGTYHRIPVGGLQSDDTFD